MLSNTPGAEIFYTIDGSDPDVTSVVDKFVGQLLVGSGGTASGREAIVQEAEVVPTKAGTRRYNPDKPVLLEFKGTGFQEFVVTALAMTPDMRQSRISRSPVYRVQGQVRPVSFKAHRSDDTVLLSMETATPGATIYFEEAEKDPRPQFSVRYQEPIRVRSRVVRAVAVRSDMTMSATTCFLLQDQLLAPVASVEGIQAMSSSLDQPPVVVFKDEATVTVKHMDEGKPGYAVFYSRNGQIATTLCPKYRHPIRVTETGKHRMCFIAMAPMYADSDEVWIDFVVMRQVPPPIISPSPGIYKQYVTVNFHIPTYPASAREEEEERERESERERHRLDGGSRAPRDTEEDNLAPARQRLRAPDLESIFFTISGQRPVPTGEDEPLAQDTHLFKKPLLITRTCIVPPKGQADTEFKKYDADPGDPVRFKVRAMSCRKEFIDSLETTSELEILDQVQRPTSKPKPKLYTELVDVTLFCATPGATIYYTLDGTNPRDYLPKTNLNPRSPSRSDSRAHSPTSVSPYLSPSLSPSHVGSSPQPRSPATPTTPKSTTSPSLSHASSSSQLSASMSGILEYTGEFRYKFSKVLQILALWSTYTRALTFEDFCQAHARGLCVANMLLMCC